MDYKKTEELYNNTPENVTSVSLGYKIKNGKETDEVVVVFGVKKKLLKSELNPSEILPSYIMHQGEFFNTDVVETTESTFHQCFKNESLNPAQSYYSSNSIIRELQTSPTNPLKGGFQITQYPTGWVKGKDAAGNEVLYSSVGTVGIFAVDAIDNRVVAITNTHVAVSQWEAAADRDVAAEKAAPYNILEPQYNSALDTTATPQLLINNSPAQYESFAFIKRYSPYHPERTNFVDCAVLALNTTRNISHSIYQYNGLEDYNDFLPFASKIEIDNLLITKPEVYSTGRTTGPKGYKTARVLFEASLSCAGVSNRYLWLTAGLNRPTATYAKIEFFKNVSGNMVLQSTIKMPQDLTTINEKFAINFDKIRITAWGVDILGFNDIACSIKIVDENSVLVPEQPFGPCINNATYGLNDWEFIEVYCQHTWNGAAWVKTFDSCGSNCSCAAPSYAGVFSGQVVKTSFKNALIFTNAEQRACKMRVSQLGVTENIGGYVFSDMIRYEYKNHVVTPDWPSAPGDSGSILIANFDGVWKIIGLCFAGNSLTGLACRIDRVASEMKIKSWDPSYAPNTTTGTPEIAVSQVSGANADKTSIAYAGKTFWQAGLTKISTPVIPG